MFIITPLSWLIAALSCAVHIILTALLLVLQSLKTNGLFTAELARTDSLLSSVPSIAIQNISLGIDSACVGYGDRVQCTDFSDLITAITKLPIASDLLPLLQTIQKFDAQVALKMDIFVTLLAFIGMLLARFIMTPFRFSIRFVLWVLSGFCALAPVVSLLIVFNAPIGALQGAGFVVQSGLAESLLIGALAASATMVVAAGLALLLP